MTRRTMTEAEVCRVLGISEAQLARLVQLRKLAVIEGRVSVRALTTFIRENRVRPGVAS